MIVKDEERQKILNKMEKLLAHTGDGAVNVNEIAIANKLLKKLADDYGVSIEEIKNINDKETLIKRIEVTAHRNPRKWAGSLSVILADFYECRCIKIKNKFCFIGFDLDCQFASEVFSRLYTQIGHVSRMNAIDSNNFSFGVVIALHSRLEEIRQNRMAMSGINALVIVKKDAVSDQVKKMFPRLNHGSRAKYRKSGDFYRGIEYGKTIEIFKNIKEG